MNAHACVLVRSNSKKGHLSKSKNERDREMEKKICASKSKSEGREGGREGGREAERDGTVNRTSFGPARSHTILAKRYEFRHSWNVFWRRIITLGRRDLSVHIHTSSLCTWTLPLCT